MDRNKAKGMLWGLVVGDAFGSPIQFSGKDSHPWITEMRPCETFKTPAGYWTDDTSMSLCVMESYIRLGKYDLRDIAENFVRWFREGRFSSLPYAFDVGTATRQAIVGIEEGSLKNGTEASQGNGSVMRFAPSYFIAEKYADPRICDDISDLTHCSRTIRETVIQKIHGILTEHLAGRRTVLQPSHQARARINNSGWAVSTLDAAIWAFKTTDSFEDGMIQAVNLGGDADSIGTVYGQIAGAYYGFSSIPQRWIRDIKDKEKLNETIETFLLLTR